MLIHTHASNGPAAIRPAGFLARRVAGVAAVLLLGAGVGVAGTLVLTRDSSETVTPVRTPATASGPASAPTASPSPTAEPEVEGPQASTYAAVDGKDLEKVCDREIYFPRSPKRAGKAPHPVVLLRGFVTK